MRLVLALGALASATLVAANGKKGLGSGPGAALFARQTEFCTTGDTCAECYGEGNIVCEVSWCYNPDAGEQCCGDGSYCIGSPSCCGSAGLGTPGGDESPSDDDTPPSTPTFSDEDDSPAATTSSAPDSTPSTWDCEASDSNEECCQRGSPSFDYCPGGDTLTNIVCYDPTSEACCSDGTTCLGSASCCGAAGVAESSSVEEEATSRVSTSRAGVTNAPTTTRNTGGQTTGGAGGNNAASTGAANVMAAVESVAAVAAGVLGLALL